MAIVAAAVLHIKVATAAATHVEAWHVRVRDASLLMLLLMLLLTTTVVHENDVVHGRLTCWGRSGAIAVEVHAAIAGERS